MKKILSLGLLASASLWADPITPSWYASSGRDSAAITPSADIQFGDQRPGGPPQAVSNTGETRVAPRPSAAASYNQVMGQPGSNNSVPVVTDPARLTPAPAGYDRRIESDPAAGFGTATATPPGYDPRIERGLGTSSASSVSSGSNPPPAGNGKSASYNRLFADDGPGADELSPLDATAPLGIPRDGRSPEQVAGDFTLALYRGDGPALAALLRVPPHIGDAQVYRARLARCFQEQRPKTPPAPVQIVRSTPVQGSDGQLEGVRLTVRQADHSEVELPLVPLQESDEGWRVLKGEVDFGCAASVSSLAPGDAVRAELARRDASRFADLNIDEVRYDDGENTATVKVSNGQFSGKFRAIRSGENWVVQGEVP